MTSSDYNPNNNDIRPRRIDPGLSTREKEVLLAWIQCDSKSVVSQRLYIAPGTVNTHLTRIRGKYDEAGRTAPTKAALLARALQDGLIGIDEL
ncbi:LuxR family transcriptional regulator [Rhodococcus sp. KBS0724]|jgi:DNA-binding CsgD family transcriptional regulator|uniref:helix-turn-helix transcriptional regulator n=1 Tax=Rhodococcus sp. KBS0724 TaxID=1179674 RepID=UPI00110EB6B7|nr:LuxR family transcriptional regulator [Rhodococcus sp. KBS0724]